MPTQEDLLGSNLERSLNRKRGVAQSDRALLLRRIILNVDTNTTNQNRTGIEDTGSSPVVATK